MNGDGNCGGLIILSTLSPMLSKENLVRFRNLSTESLVTFKYVVFIVKDFMMPVFQVAS